jgi:hypothetical protein
MDDATMNHLIKRRIPYSKPKQTFSKEYAAQILELTQQLIDHPQSGELQIAFDQYVSECIHHFNQLKQPIQNSSLLPALECDKIMFPPKKINVFVKKK